MIQDVYPQKRVSCRLSMPNISFRIKQSYESKKGQSLVLQMLQHSSYLACAMVRSIVMLAQANFSLMWGIFHVCGYMQVQSQMSPRMD